MDGTRCLVIVDNNERLERSRERGEVYVGGIYTDEILIYIHAEDLPGLPRINRLLKFDGIDYRVKDAIDEMGIFSITLEANDH